MIRNIIFDIGGVLADFRIKEFLMEKGFDAPMIKRILKASVMSPYWGSFERGEITEEEALKGFAASDPEIEENLRTAFSSIAGMLTMRDYAIPLVKALKALGLGVYYLSNYSKKAYDECAGSLGFMPYMDGGLVSFLAGKTKPDPEMYSMFLEKFGLRAEECVFIDDTPENVDAADALGLAGIVFHDLEGLLSSLRVLDVSVADLDMPEEYLIIDLEFCKTDKYRAKLHHYYLSQEIIQIGAVILDADNQVVDRFNSLVQPVYGMPDKFITELTGISEADLQDAPGLKKALDSMAAWIGGRKLVAGSWSSTDYRQLTREMEQKHISNPVIEALFPEWVDLQKAYRDMTGEEHSKSLSDAMSKEAVEVEGRLHDGSVDALNTARLISKIRASKEQSLRVEAIEKSTEYTEDMGFTLGSAFSNIRFS